MRLDFFGFWPMRIANNSSVYLMCHN